MSSLAPARRQVHRTGWDSAFPAGEDGRGQVTSAPTLFADAEVGVLDRAGQVLQGLCQKPGNGEGGHTDSIDGEEQEAAVGVKQLRAIGNQAWKALLKTPDFAIRATAELRWIEDDAIVAATAADFAGGELGSVINDPADRAF